MGPRGHVGGEGKAQGEGGYGLEDRVGPGEDLRALWGPHGHVGGKGKAQGEGGVVMDLRMELDLVKI